MFVSKTTKFFAEYLKTIEILIVNHDSFNCIEMIVLGVLDKNKPIRMYLDSLILLNKLDIKLFNASFDIKQKCESRENFDVEHEMKELAFTMISSLLINRVRIAPIHTEVEYEVYFEPNYSDCGNIKIDSFGNLVTQLDFELSNKPQGLIPYTKIQR